MHFLFTLHAFFDFGLFGLTAFCACILLTKFEHYDFFSQVAFWLNSHTLSVDEWGISGSNLGSTTMSTSLPLPTNYDSLYM